MSRHSVSVSWEDPTQLIEARRVMSGSELFERIISGQLPRAPFSEVLGLRPVAITPGSARFELDVTPRLDNSLGIVHGGAIASLIDMTLSGTGQTLAAPGEAYVTVRLEVDYKKPARIDVGKLFCEGSVAERQPGSVKVEASVKTIGGVEIARGVAALVRVTTRPA